MSMYLKINKGDWVLVDPRTHFKFSGCTGRVVAAEIRSNGPVYEVEFQGQGVSTYKEENLIRVTAEAMACEPGVRFAAIRMGCYNKTYYYWASKDYKAGDLVLVSGAAKGEVHRIERLMTVMEMENNGISPRDIKESVIAKVIPDKKLNAKRRVDLEQAILRCIHDCVDEKIPYEMIKEYRTL